VTDLPLDANPIKTMVIVTVINIKVAQAILPK
jgi:hypothetical protein